MLLHFISNTRALAEDEAVERAFDIGKNLAPRKSVVSRSDSTLRGHFPAEVNALTDGLGWLDPIVLVAPAFFDGGRVTVKDEHYVVAASADFDRRE